MLSKGQSYASIQARLNWFKVAQERNVKYACLYFGISRKTYYKWKRRYQLSGQKSQSLLDQSRRPKYSPGKVSLSVEELILKLRDELECGPRLLAFYLSRDYGVRISPYGVYKTLKRHAQLRPYRKRKRFKKRYTSLYIKSPGQKVQVDVKYCPRLKNHPQLYQYTSIDCFSRTRFAYIYTDRSAQSSVNFLKRVVAFYPFKIRCVQTDHGMEFTYAMYPEFKVRHPLDVACGFYGIKHKLIPIATPHHNGIVENSHGKDDKECYGPAILRLKSDVVNLMRARNEQWNLKRPHQALGFRTPIEWLRLTKGYEQSSLNFKEAYQIKGLYADIEEVDLVKSLKQRMGYL